jgi:rubrerythrin
MPKNTHSVAPELDLIDVGTMTRSSFILKSALAVGTTAGAAAVGPFVTSALAQGGGGDVDILNFALTLEYLETRFYKEAAKLDLSSAVAKLAKQFAEEEQEHVNALKGAVKQSGGTPAPKPVFDFGVTDEASFLKLAQTLEDTGVSAYNGAGPLLKNKDLLAAAGSIVQIEARHAAAIRLQNKANPAPDAFDKALDKAAVLKAVTPLIKGLLQTPRGRLLSGDGPGGHLPPLGTGWPRGAIRCNSLLFIGTRAVGA